MANPLIELSNSLADAVEHAGKSVITVHEGGREGVSGTVWRTDLAVTAEHTIRGYDEVTVTLPSGEKTKATVAGRDPGTDIAVLKLSGNATAAAIADSSSVRVGEIVLAVGRRAKEGLATTYGVVSAIGGAWRTWHGSQIDRWFRLDLNPFSGFSGGPIITARGEVIGIATSGPRRSVMTIPASTVNRIVDQLLKNGRISRGYLGVAMQPVAFPDSTRESLKIPTDRGLLIVTVASGSPADRAGLLVGDIIVSAAGSAIRSTRDLQAVLDPENVGKGVPFEVVRGGQLTKVAVTIAERNGE